MFADRRIEPARPPYALRTPIGERRILPKSDTMRPVITALVLLLGVASFAAAEEEYTLTNITGWTPAQLATLPHFDRFVPAAPAGATPDFNPVCANGLGMVAGNRSDSNGDDGAVVVGGGQTDIGAWGRWNWSYWLWDGHDNHYYWGSVERSPVRAANVLGQVLGYANLGGGSSEFATRNDWDDHIYLYDAALDEKTDLTPGAHRCDARDLNDRGDVAGYWSDESTYHPFRRSASGTFTDFVYDEPSSHTIAPAVINNGGHVAGLVTVWTTPRDYIPFISTSGSGTTPLPYPDQLNNYNASIRDINDHDVIVGYYYKADTPLETLALRWKNQNGSWVVEELIELLVDNHDFILDRAVAVNDAGYIICTGHADDGPDDTWNTHTFLLTPLEFPPPAATTLSAGNATSTGVTIRAKINAGNLSTTGMFEYGTSTGYGTHASIAPVSGTHPMLARLPLTGLTAHTRYHYRITATNSAGTTYGMDESFTTAWDWTSWAASNLGGATDPHSDSNGNGSPDGIDYATANDPTLACVVANGQLQVRFKRLTAADGITLLVQVTDDLLNTWPAGSSYSLAASIPDTAVSTEVSRIAASPESEWITVAIDASVRTRFVRLKAVMP